MKDKQFFLDRIGKRIFRDKSTCPCPVCKEIEENGLVITDEEAAEYIYEIQCAYAEEGKLLNYRDEK